MEEFKELDGPVDSESLLVGLSYPAGTKYRVEKIYSQAESQNQHYELALHQSLVVVVFADISLILPDGSTDRVTVRRRYAPRITKEWKAGCTQIPGLKLQIPYVTCNGEQL